MPKVSIVIPLYNQEKYVLRFISSLTNQSLKEFEALFIDDKSTDNSVKLVQDYIKNDDRFKLVCLPENKGAGAARNLGITMATGETLCFADPDDILPENSLELRYSAYKKHNAIIRACHIEADSDGKIINEESCPQHTTKPFFPVHEALHLGINPFLSAHWAWLFPTKLLQKQKIFNEEGTRTAEDIMFLVRLFFKISRIVWLPDPVYYWIKQKDSLSTVTYSVQHYLDYFQCVDAFYEQANSPDTIVLGDMLCNEYLFSYLAHLTTQLFNGKSTEQDAQIIIDYISSVCHKYGTLTRMVKGKISPDRSLGVQWLMSIQQDLTAPLTQKMINGYRNILEQMNALKYEHIRNAGWEKSVRFDAFDQERNLLRIRYLFYKNYPDEQLFFNGKALNIPYAKKRTVIEAVDPNIFERILWLPIPESTNEPLELVIGGEATSFSASAIHAKFTQVAPPPNVLPPNAIALRQLARSNAIKRRFADAWMFIDKDTEADDNAEHLYRHIMHNKPEINIWFVLSDTSHDWNRLEKEGFKLVPFGSDAHKALYLNAKKLISSQMDTYIFNCVDKVHFADFAKPQFICLPHGVTKDDVSNWFNSIPFDLFIAATPMELSSIVEDNTPYLMGHKEVRLGGFPRYDKWLEPIEKENVIFVMPTWRANLVGAWDGKGQLRDVNPDFYSSSYVSTWKNFFESPKLKELLDATNYRIVFFAHPCVEPYLDELPFPDFVEKRSKKHGSIVKLMQKSKLLITDFSSVAFDMAYMLSPVIYYQYESKLQFTQQQAWKNGYIDYETMGFGPVCHTQGELIETLSKYLNNNCVLNKAYLERIENTFPYRDANCCSRALSFIMEDSHSYNEKE